MPRCCRHLICASCVIRCNVHHNTETVKIRQYFSFSQLPMCTASSYFPFPKGFFSYVRSTFKKHPQQTLKSYVLSGLHLLKFYISKRQVWLLQDTIQCLEDNCNSSQYYFFPRHSSFILLHQIYELFSSKLHTKLSSWN